MFASDRDLVQREPLLMTDVSWAGQRVWSGTVGVVGTTLTATAGPGLLAQGVAPGMVTRIAGLSVEITAIASETEAAVSLLRPRAGDPVIAPPAIASAEAQIVSFGPQIELVHRQVLRMAGLEDGASVTNPAALVEVEALGALAMVLSVLGASSPAGSALARRADHWQAQFERARREVVVEVDLDGDGAPDAARRLNGLVLTRG